MAMSADNNQKYDNYKEQFKRLDKALRNGFNLEAIFIEYSIIEDRIESILKHAEKWEAYLKKRGRYQVTLDSKINYISCFARERGSLLYKYFGDHLLAEILAWKEERNQLIHALMKQALTTDELQRVALDGKDFARKLSNKVTNYRRAVERRSKR